MRSSRRRLLGSRELVGGLVAVAVLAGGGGAWALTRSDATAATPAETLVAASTGTARQTVTATGTIEPARKAVLSFPVAGTVTSVPVEVGQVVTMGQALATVGTTTLASAVQTAQAGVTAARAALTAAQDAGASTTQRASARAQVASATSRLDGAQQALDQATLTSSIAGTVASVGLAVGDRVPGSSAGGGQTGASAAAASATTGTGTITVISTDAYVVDASVGSADLARVQKGLQAEITPTGAAQRVFATVASVGIVASTSATSSATASAATFPVVLDVTGAPSGLYAGGTASVVIVVSQTEGVLTVPTQALHTTAAGTVVHQRRDGKQVSTPVTVGTSYGATTQITKGLADGEQVLVSTAVPGAAGGATRRAGQNGFGAGGTGGSGTGGRGTRGGAATGGTG